MIMATKRMKQDDETEQDQEPETMLEDRISELPDGVILHILSFIPTVFAVRMSILSKRWRHMWTMVPTLDFRDSRDAYYFRRPDDSHTGRKKFLSFVDECLKRPYADTTISKFKLDMEFYGGGGRVDAWLWFPVKKKVKELELRFGNRRATYSLPRTILQLRSLTLLRLSGVALGTLSTASLPSLKALYLLDVEMDDQILNSILLGCPSLEKFCLDHCIGLLDPQVSSLSLKSMVFRNGGMHGHCQMIKVEAVNLYSFEYGSRCIRGTPKCSMNLARCQEIRNLLLYDACLADRWFEDLIPQLPHLESLTLYDCYGMRCMNICNQHLKNFVFISDRKWMSLEVTLVTPSLVYFSYTGCSMFKISLNAPNLLDANIKVSDYGRKNYDNDWYANLIKFLSEFNGCKNVHMFCFSKKALIVPDELRKMFDPPLPDLKYLKVRAGGGPSYKKLIFRKSLLWIAPSLKTLLIE